MGTVRLTGQLMCADDAEAAQVRAYLPRHIALSRAEPGCLRFDVVATDDPRVWQVDEKFTDSNSFRAHQVRAGASEWARATSGIRRTYVVDGLDE